MIMNMKKIGSSSDGNCVFYSESTVTSKRETFIKYCTNPEKNKQYYDLFQLEAQHLDKLYEIMEKAHQEALYCRLFPCSVSSGCDPETGMAYIRMAYIQGITLEEYLRDQYRCDMREPRRLIPPDKLSHLFEQLYTAFTWLDQAGIISFDVSPWNIIITNENTFDIRLVDFTHSGYTDSDGRLLTRPQRYMDAQDWLDESPLPLQIWNHYVLLFTRMFFTGKEQYAHNFSPDREDVRRFFFKDYDDLANLVLNADLVVMNNQTLIKNYIAQTRRKLANGSCVNTTYLADWHAHLQDILRHSF